jgi:two-component system chemotaxis response regulator CheB
MKKIRVLVVDDSFFMRKAITKIISNDEIEVIDTAENGQEAIKKNRELHPDLITMDVEMPVMNGIDALKEIMRVKPTPVIMLSTITTEGANLTVEALSLGAMDFITKKNAFKEMDSIKDELVSKILNVSRNSDVKNQVLRRTSLLLNKRKGVTTQQNAPTEKSKSTTSNKTVRRPKSNDVDIILIGISTGGPVALMDVIPKLDANINKPILIAQHMPPHFTKSLAQRLDQHSKLNVKEADDDDRILPGNVYIAPGGLQTRVRRNGKLQINDDPPNELYKPSVNVLLDSATDIYGKRTLCFIMTGMGKDGADACERLKQKNGFVVAQKPETCVVPGMPSAVISKDLQDEIISLNNIPNYLNSIFV